MAASELRLTEEYPGLIPPSDPSGISGFDKGRPMDAGDLRVFEAVARLGSMNRAAAELNTVQSNVTTRIHALEYHLGTSLFDRHSRGTVLTSSGQRLLPFAIRIGNLLREAKQAVKDNGRPMGPLSIGALEATAAYRLPSLIAHFAKCFPLVDLSLKEASNETLLRLVRGRELDAAFVCGPIRDPSLRHDIVYREELAIATPFGASSFEEFGGGTNYCVVVKGPGCCYRERLEALLHGLGVHNFRRLEVSTSEAIIGCVAAGVGMSLLPRSAVARAVRSRRVTTHRPPPAQSIADTWLVWPEEQYCSSALKAFLSIIRDQAAAARLT